MKIKTKIIALSSCVLVGATSFALINAYFTNDDSKVNKIQLQNNTIDIDEDFEKPTVVVENSSFTKAPSVRVTEGVDCYVRIFCEFDDTSDADFASMNFDTTNWTTKQDDGYYYYKSKLEVGDKTKPLFNKVTIGADTAEDIQDFDIIVYAESVQAYNADSKEFYADAQTAFEAWDTGGKK